MERDRSNPQAATPDWDELRLRTMQRIRTRLRNLPPTTLEDLAQEVLVTLFRLSRREPLVNPGVLAATLADRVCVDHVRRLRGPVAAVEPLPDPGAPLELPLADGSRGLPLDVPELLRFLIHEHLRVHDAACQGLAADFFVEQSWSAVASRLETRHPTVIKRWARCMQRVRPLVRRGAGAVWEWARAARLA